MSRCGARSTARFVTSIAVRAGELDQLSRLDWLLEHSRRGAP